MRVIPQERDRFRAIRGTGNVVARDFQEAADYIAHRGLVVEHQNITAGNRFRLQDLTGFIVKPRPALGRIHQAWQVDADARPMTGFTFHREESLMATHDAKNHR